MPLELRPLARDQVPEAAQVTADSIGENPFRKLLFPQGMTEGTIASLRDGYYEAFDNPDSHMMQIYDTDTNRLAAYCLWIHTPEMTEEKWDKKLEERLGYFSDAKQELLRPLLEQENAAKRKVMGSGRWWELDSLMVAPEYQRQGLGGRLMTWGENILEKKQLQSVIVSTPAGFGLYKRRGYEVQEQYTVDLEKGGGQGTYFNAVLTRFPKST